MKAAELHVRVSRLVLDGSLAGVSSPLDAAQLQALIVERLEGAGDTGRRRDANGAPADALSSAIAEAVAQAVMSRVGATEVAGAAPPIDLGGDRR